VTVRLGIGGFSMGAATAMYSATCFAAGKYSDGSAYPANLSAIVGLSGWLPCSKFGFSSLFFSFVMYSLHIILCSVTSQDPE
jgi:hypothetical protein